VPGFQSDDAPEEIIALWVRTTLPTSAARAARVWLVLVRRECLREGPLLRRQAQPSDED
jgi:hypothetical protein